MTIKENVGHGLIGQQADRVRAVNRALDATDCEQVSESVVSFAPKPNFIELLKQKILLEDFLLSRNEQDTSSCDMVVYLIA